MDVESNLTLDESGDLSYSAISSRVAVEVVMTIFFMLVICADVAIIYTIFCYKRLRTVPNILYANWVVSDLLCATFTPSGYKILTVISKGALSHEFLCFLEQFGATFHLTVNLFVIVVLIDWFIAAYFGRASQKFRDSYVFVTGMIWVSAVVYGGTASGICFRYFSYFVHHVLALLVTYCLAALLVIVLQISRIVQKLRRSCDTSPTMNLTFGTIYAAGALLSVIQLFLVGSVGVVFEVCLVVTLFGANLVNLGVLLLKNSDFRACLMLAVKCRPDNDDLQFDFQNPIANVTVNKQRLESESSSVGSQEFLTQIN